MSECGIVDVFPASWFTCDLKRWIMDFIRNLDIDPVDKKKEFVCWSRIAHCPFTRADVEYVTGQKSGEV